MEVLTKMAKTGNRDIVREICSFLQFEYNQYIIYTTRSGKRRKNKPTLMVLPMPFDMYLYTEPDKSLGYCSFREFSREEFFKNGFPDENQPFEPHSAPF